MTDVLRFLEALGDALIVTDTDLRVTHWNRAAEQLFGYTLAEIHGQLASAFLASGQTYEWSFPLLRTVRAGQVWRGSVRLRHKKGHLISVDLTANSLKNADGECTSYVTLCRPAIEPPEETSTISKSGVLFHSSNDIVIVLDHANRIAAWNPAAERVMKWKAMETLGHSFEEFIQTKEELKQIVAAIKRNGSWRGEVALRDRDGEEIILDSDVTSVRDHSGKGLGIITISRDITVTRRNDAARRSMEQKLSESEERFRQLVEQKQVGVYLMQDERFRYANPRFAELCGYERDELLAMPSTLLIVVEEDRERVADYLRRRLLGEVVPPYGFRVLRKDGGNIDIEVYGALILYQGRPAVLGTVIDITQRKSAEAALRESEERYRTLVDALQEGVVFMAPDGQVLTCNESARRLLGISREQVLESARDGTLSKILHADGSVMPPEDFPANITLRTGQAVSEAIVGLSKPTGELTWLSVNARPLLRDGDNQPYAVVTSFVDITQRKHSEEDLQRRAFYDALTGLPNRALFMDRVERALSQARRSAQMVAIGFLDLDLFKNLNDTHGHISGDLVLQQMAARLCRCLREGDTVARMGGDEFTLLLPNVNGVSEAARVAERVLEALRQPLSLEKTQFILTASLGVSLFPQDGNEAMDLLSRADNALYRAKRSGKNIYRIFGGTPTPSSSAQSVPPSPQEPSGEHRNVYNSSRPPGNRGVRN